MQQRISIIEDDLEICNLLKEFLKESGYEIKISNTGIDGMRELRTLTYDLVILDLMLPYKSGDEILRELRSFSNIPVIVLSAKDMVHTKVDLLRLGADDYVTKPFDLFLSGNTGPRYRRGKESNSKRKYTCINFKGIWYFIFIIKSSTKSLFKGKFI